MIRSIYPCLWFDGTAKEAADFYCSIFTDSKITSENPMVVLFEINGKRIMGLNGGPYHQFTPSISLFVNCASIEETNEVWSKLIEGGSAMIEIGEHPWSKRYGWLKDRYGMTWQISVAEDQQRKIIPSFLFTDQLFGRAEEAIQFYTSLFENSSIDGIHYYPEGDSNAGKVMFSEFKLNNYQLIAMDGPGTHNYSFNEAVSLVVNCETQDEIDYLWNTFALDGREDRCGWVKDKFGVSWQIVPSILGELMGNPEKAPRVVEAFMKMTKFDIQQLLDA